jgi:uracil-DNA glycosylase family 4
LPTSSLRSVRDAIVGCQRCARLRSYCGRIAREKRAAYRDELYWGKPVPGFGDPRARVLILGLAPAAHGANRTGRVFTGDGIGGSGDFLMGALHRGGFASLPTSRSANDGLRLHDAYIAATVRCAPPDNKPLPEEIAACADHLDAEVAALPRLRVVLALGRIAWDAWFHHLRRLGLTIRPRPAFGHGEVFDTAGCLTVVGAYHPSRQNTNTGKLTAKMYDEVIGIVSDRLRQ